MAPPPCSGSQCCWPAQWCGRSRWCTHPSWRASTGGCQPQIHGHQATGRGVARGCVARGCGEGGDACAHTHTHTHTLHTYLTNVHQVVICYDVHRTWQLSCRCLLRHLLDAEGLVVPELTHTKLSLQWVVIFVLRGVS